MITILSLLLFPVLQFTTTEVCIDTLREDDASVVVSFPFVIKEAEKDSMTNSQDVSANNADKDLCNRNISNENLYDGIISNNSLCDDNISDSNLSNSHCIHIIKGITSCPCTQLLDYPKGPLCVGDSGQISVLFNPAGQSEDVLRDIAIYCAEDTLNPIAELQLSTYVAPPSDIFYDFPLRADPLRALPNCILFSAVKPERTLLLANVSDEDSLKISVKGFVRKECCISRIDQSSSNSDSDAEPQQKQNARNPFIQITEDSSLINKDLLIQIAENSLIQIKKDILPPQETGSIKLSRELFSPMQVGPLKATKREFLILIEWENTTTHGTGTLAIPCSVTFPR